MISERTECKLADIGKIITGKTPSTKIQGNFGGEIPFVTPKDLDGRRIIDKTERYITRKGLETIINSLIPANAVIMSCIGSEMGKAAIAGKECVTNQQLNSIIVNKNHCAHYIYYNLSLRQKEIKGIASGSALPILNKNDFSKISISIPSLPEQRAIANILGSLDDKIQLNREMNETLEGMARAIFKSWFVDFDPVKAKAAGIETGLPPEIESLFPDRFEDSELGPIPKGWQIALLPKAFDINPKRSLAIGTIAPYLDMKNMPTNSIRPGAWIVREFTSGTKFMNGDTLVARITPCLENGKTAFVDFLKEGQIGWGSTEYIVLRSKPIIPLEYSYFIARSDSFRKHAITNMTGSSGRQRVPTTCFDSYHVVIPPMEISSYFGNFAQNVLQLIKNNDIETNHLSSIRDLLLPRLISGEIRVPGISE